MPDTKRRLLIPATLALVLAACGGGGGGGPTGGPSSGPTQGGASSEPTEPASTDAVPTDGGAETPGATATDGGGGGATDACALVSADEAGGILGASGVTTELTPGDFSYCFYRDSSGDAIAATSYSARGGAGSFAVWKASAGVQQVDGIGDDAVFDPSSATLFVLNGDAILGVTAGISSDSEAQRLDWAKQFGEIAADRM